MTSHLCNFPHALLLIFGCLILTASMRKHVPLQTCSQKLMHIEFLFKLCIQGYRFPIFHSYSQLTQDYLTILLRIYKTADFLLMPLLIDDLMLMIDSCLYVFRPAPRSFTRHHCEHQDIHPTRNVLLRQGLISHWSTFCRRIWKSAVEGGHMFPQARNVYLRITRNRYHQALTTYCYLLATL
jgi:hypothetical protein